MKDNCFSFPCKRVFYHFPLSNRILIHDVQEEVEKQFDVKEDNPGRHSYAKYNNWNKVSYKMPVLPKRKMSPSTFVVT